MTKKQLLAKVTSPSGTSLAVWSDFLFNGFTKELNAGPGECILRLPQNFDYSEVDVLEGNFVDIEVSDWDTQQSKTPGEPTILIYSGYISRTYRTVDKDEEKLEINLLGHYTKLGTDILKNSAQTTLYSEPSVGLTVTAADLDAADIGLMMRALLDRYIAENPGTKINYQLSDIPNASLTATYSLEQKTYREAMEKLKSMAPPGTQYYIDVTGKVSFKPMPTTPTHKFVFGKHFKAVQLERSMEKVRNFLLVWNGETGAAKVYKHYQDDASILQYGRRVEVTNDYGIDNVNAADAIGAKFLAENKDPGIKMTCSILDNNGVSLGSDGMPSAGYDIETIQPGDTCSFYGYDPDFAEIFRDNMLITKVDYRLDRVDIEVEIIRSGILDFQEQQRRDLGDISSGGLKVPESYT
jgi:hypothetical protein